jgi:hypothetical protein
MQQGTSQHHAAGPYCPFSRPPDKGHVWVIQHHAARLQPPQHKVVMDVKGVEEDVVQQGAGARVSCVAGLQQQLLGC